MSEDQAKKLVGYGYGVNFDLGNGRTIQVTGSIYLDDTDADIDRKLDRVMDRLERQRSRAEIPMLEAELQVRRKRLDEIDFHIKTAQAQLDALNNIEPRLRRPSYMNDLKQLQAAIENHKLNRLRVEEAIPEGEQAVADAKLKAA